MTYKINLRHNSRIVALTTLFSYMFAEEEDIYPIGLFKDEYGNLEFDESFYEKIYKGVIENIEKIDKIISLTAPDWPLKNISKIDLVILRIGIFELEFLKENAKNIVIDEAVELAKKFGNDSSSKFINGVLDNLERK